LLDVAACRLQAPHPPHFLYFFQGTVHCGVVTSHEPRESGSHFQVHWENMDGEVVDLPRIQVEYSIVV